MGSYQYFGHNIHSLQEYYWVSSTHCALGIRPWRRQTRPPSSKRNVGIMGKKEITIGMNATKRKNWIQRKEPAPRKLFFNFFRKPDRRIKTIQEWNSLNNRRLRDLGGSSRWQNHKPHKKETVSVQACKCAKERLMHLSNERNPEWLGEK